MLSKKLITACFMLTCIFSVKAEVNVLTISAIDEQAGYSYRFPVLQSSNSKNDLALANINKLLQFSELELYSPNNDKKQMFLDSKNRPLARDYKVIYQNDQLITLSISRSYKVANASDNETKIQKHTNNYVFDLDTGRLIAPSVLFSSKGLDWLNDTLMEQRASVYDQEIDQLKQQLQQSNVGQDAIKKKLAQYEEAKLWSVEESGFTVKLTSNPQDLQIVEDAIVMIDSNSIFIDESKKQNRNIEKAWYNKFTHKQLVPYISVYGKCLLIDIKKSCKPVFTESVVPGIWSGKSDGNNITVVVTRYDPHYMDGMGHALFGYLIWNNESPIEFNINGEHSCSPTCIKEELTLSGRPIFRGKLQFIVANGKKYEFYLTFLQDGRWIGVGDTQKSNKLKLFLN